MSSLSPGSRRLTLVVCLVLMLGPVIPLASAQVATPQRDYWPTAGWRTASPESQGLDPTLLAQIDQRLETELPRVTALLVVRGGDLVFERYQGAGSSSQSIHLWSVTKSVTDMAVGLAVADGLLRLDQTLGELIPERIPAGADPRTASVTVENLLTMTSGWAWDSTTDFLHLEMRRTGPRAHSGCR
jgi:CubicO group peptidase (beta-lactamase class C family)